MSQDKTPGDDAGLEFAPSQASRPSGPFEQGLREEGENQHPDSAPFGAPEVPGRALPALDSATVDDDPAESSRPQASLGEPDALGLLGRWVGTRVNENEADPEPYGNADLG